MVYQITDGKLSIDDFELPNGCYLEPVKHDEMRLCVEDGSTASYYILNKTTLERRQVLPPDVERVRMLILGLDEGSIGTAGVAAAAFLLKKTIWAKFDKIHRIIRDLKLADGGCCNKVFEKAKLWSAYIFGLNNRPFGSGANYSVKELS